MRYQKLNRIKHGAGRSRKAALITVILVAGVIIALGSLQRAHAAQATIDSSIGTVAVEKQHAGTDEVFISDQVGYIVYTASTKNCVYSKTTDGGTTWSAPTDIDSSGNCMNPVIWYDRWTPGNTTGTIIHIYLKLATTNEVGYNEIDTSNDTVSNGTTPIIINSDKTNTLNPGVNRIFTTEGTDGTSWAGVHDSGVAGDQSWIKKCSSACNTAANWVDATPSNMPVLQQEDGLMMPLSSGNIMYILNDFGGASNVVESEVYTAGTSSWAGSFTTIDASAGSTNTTYRGTLTATVNRSTGAVYLAYVTDNSSLSAGINDIRTASYSGGSWTNKTDVLTDSTMGITRTAISIDENTGNLYVAYTAQTTGGTATTADIFYKSSTDGMTTWSTQSSALDTTSGDLRGMSLNIMSNERIYVTWHDPDGTNPDELYGNTVVDLTPPAPPSSAGTVIDSSMYVDSYAKLGSQMDTVFISDQVGYVFYMDTGATCVYSKTTDGGASWGTAVSVYNATTCGGVSVWYDGWQLNGGTGGSIIHIIVKDGFTSDVYYNELNTTNDTLSNGSSPVDISTDKSNSFPYDMIDNKQFISRDVNGGMWVGVPDSGGAGDTPWIKYCSSSCNTATNWVDRTPGVGLNSQVSEYQLLPLSGGSMLLVGDDVATSNIVSLKYTSGGSWDASETVIDASPGALSGGYGGRPSVTQNRATGTVYLAYSAQNSTLGTDDDFRTALYSSGSWTAKTDILTNSSMGLTRVSLGLDDNTGDIYAAYSAQTTPGTATSTNIYYKKSTDGMTTWGTQSSPLNTAAPAEDFYGLKINPNSNERLYATWQDSNSSNPDILYGTTLIDLTPSSNTAPSAPTLSSPANAATGVSQTPQFQLSATDADSDYLRYKIQICTTSNCSAVAYTIDQTSSQTGWTGQNANGSTAYTSGTTATYNFSLAPLTGSTQYWWRAYAIDPAGTNTFSTASGIRSFTTAAGGGVVIRGGTVLGGGTKIQN